MSNRDCFESMRPKEISRNLGVILMIFKDADAYDFFKEAELVDSKGDFKRQCKQNTLSIEVGHLEFVNVTQDYMVKWEHFTDGIILLKKGKIIVKALREW